MAIYFNLAIDCGFDESVADAAVAHFANARVALPKTDAVTCRVTKEKKRERWYVEVWPEGMGYATHPTCRPELVSEPNQKAIRDVLYERLSKFRGYRRAIFGGESYDMLAEATPEEDSDIEYQDMVYRLQEFPSPGPGSTIAPFSDGYAVVVRQE